MKIAPFFVLLGAAAIATPATAQLVNVGGSGGVNVGAGVGVGTDLGRTVDSLTPTVDRTVNSLDRTANRTLQQELRLATAADLQAGATVRDNRGHRIGTLQSVSGNVAIVADGNRSLHVPLAQLYRSGKGLVTKLSRQQLNASAQASMSADAGASVRNH